MLASLHPNSLTPDQAVKDLIDQRARASHTRYSSVSYSQRSDSPSIYSRVEFSPTNQPQSRGGWLAPGDAMSLMGQDQSGFDDEEDEDEEDDSLTTFTRSSLDPDDHSMFPPADDDVSVISMPTPKPLSQPVSVPPAAHAPNTEDEHPPTEETEEDPRMSMLGPKMRFVSKAPWELGDDGFLEEEEEEPASTADALVMFSNKMNGWRNRDQDKSSVKGLGLTTLRSRSPGLPSPSSRKGGMFRSQNSENQREGPYGPHLSGASQSHGTIPSSASSSKFSHSVTDSLSSDHVVHRPGHAKRPPTAESALLPVHLFRSQNTSRSSHDESGSSSRSDSPPPSSRFVHPYANPELLQMPAFEPSAQVNRSPNISEDRLSEERQGSPARRTSESSTTSSPRTTPLRKASAGGVSLPVMPSRTATGEYGDNDDISQFNARPRARTSSRPGTSGSVRMAPFGDQPGSPMHNLITLEQARARVQSVPNRGQDSSNRSTPTPKSTTPSSTLVAGLGLAPGVVVDSGVIHSQAQRPGAPSVSPSDPSSGPTVPEQKHHVFSRPRTMSSGKHAHGNGFGASADGDAVPAKTIKHKKSGFMKLFQGKDKERDKDFKETASPAPDYPVRAMSTPPQLHPSSDSPVPPLPNLHNIKRVPPPLPLSVFVTSPSFPPAGSLPSRGQEGTSTSSASPPRTRQASAPAPTLNNPPTTTQENGPQASSSLGSELPRPATSAPPNQTTFEALSLRPISTMFSAKFPDLLCPSPPTENNPPSTATPKRSDDPTPPTPGFSSSRSNSMSTSSDYPMTPTSLPTPGGPPSLGLMPGEDHAGLIASLQEQIINSRKMWQRQIWELEGQVKDLKVEVEELRNTGECEVCGMAKRERRLRTPVPHSVVDRPRPRLGGGNTRSVFGGGSDM